MKMRLAVAILLASAGILTFTIVADQSAQPRHKKIQPASLPLSSCTQFDGQSLIFPITSHNQPSGSTPFNFKVSSRL